jgi:hypothetical protein
MKKELNLRFYEKNKLLVGTMPCNPWGVLAIWLHIGALQKTHKKWNSPPAHIGLDFDMLGVAIKLMKFVI